MSTVVKRETTVHEFPRRAEVAAAPSKSQFFFNRELSLLEFHARVLEEALDDQKSAARTIEVSVDLLFEPGRVFHDPCVGLKEELDKASTIVSPDGTDTGGTVAEDTGTSPGAG